MTSQDISNLQNKMSAAVREHWKAFLIEGILLVVLGLGAMIVPPLASLAHLPVRQKGAKVERPPRDKFGSFAVVN